MVRREHLWPEGWRTQYGNKTVRAYKQQGYGVFPVNPKATELEGLPVFPSISAVPVRPNLISVFWSSEQPKRQES